MKISKLHIDSYKHLENLTFDFTYQSGERKGQPLDKICFIGQSASGKTSLLELIYECNQYFTDLEIINGSSLSGFKSSVKNLNGSISFLIGNDKISLSNHEVFFKEKIYQFKNEDGSVTNLIPFGDSRNALYFKANLISDQNIDIFTKNPIDLFEKYAEFTSVNLKNLLFRHEYPTLFNDDVEPRTWIILIHEILDYRKKFNQKMSELIHKGLLAKPEKLSTEFKKWQKENPNKLEEFAEKFNPILERLNLEVDIIDTEYSIPIKNKRNDEIIPIQNTSTGTKGLLLSFLPLYKLDTKDSIILIDEPERSLYPDMQMEIMEHYKNFAPNAQFIVATHSPFIAASFEPDERFILEFDKDGKVVVRRGSSPIGDDPNDILYNDFGINYINEHGRKKHEEYLELKQKVFFEKDKKAKQKYAEELEKLGEEYNF